MENILTWLISFLKLLFPSFIGSCIAVWYKRSEYSFKDLTIYQKIFLVIYVALTITFSMIVAFYISWAVIDLTGVIYKSGYAFAIQLLTGVVSLKLIDQIMSKSDDIFNALFDGIKDTIKHFFDKFKK